MLRIMKRLKSQTKVIIGKLLPCIVKSMNGINIEKKITYNDGKLWICTENIL